MAENSTNRSDSALAKLALTGLAFGAGILCLLAFYGEADARRVSPDALPSTATATTLAGKAQAEAIAEAALEARPMNLTLAYDATQRTLEIDPADVTALNRLAYIDYAANGRITRDGLAALYRSYEVSPYGSPTVMTWRVDFARQNWSSLPDDLRRMTLSQLPVIGKIHTTWDWRAETCRDSVHEAIYVPVCRATPGSVNRHSGYRGGAQELR